MTRRRRAAAAPIAEAHDQTRRRIDGIARVASSMGAWRPAPEVLREIEAVPTRFLQLDLTTQVGGWPISRVGVIFGPSAEGKTELLLGLGASFLARGHLFGFTDLEHTTPPSWVAKLMRGIEQHPGFVALPPGLTYEQTAVEVRRFCERIAEARESGEVPPDTTGLVGVDSLSKLMPADILRRISQEAAEEGSRARGRRQGVDGIGGRAGMIKAALNSAWFDELVPLLARTRCAVALISREDLDEDDVYADNPRIKGGRAVRYESSLLARVTKHDLLEEIGGSKELVGERHIVTIHKSKVAGRMVRRPMAAFHTSNGRAAPEGFWPERDVLEAAEECGVIELRGSHYGFGKRRLGQGRAGTLLRLGQDQPLLAEIEAAVRASARPGG